MPERPDLRQIAGDIRVALDGYDRDALAEILTYVFKEYVVQSPPPLVAAQCEQIADLAGLSFAELITALQTRLDVPELALFQVNGAEVMVRVNGVLTPLSAREARAAVEPLPPPSPVAAPPPVPSAPAPTGRQTVDEAMSRGRGDLVGTGPTPIQAPPPRPGGLRVSGRTAPTPGGGAPAAAPRPATLPAPASPAPPAAPNAPASAAPPAAPTKPDAPDDDDASIRFSLLELD